ncbi:MAG: hypothetical protein G01um101466_559 [Parcubacteria group bacterium Gr01-1014_66]|nr:MAG: hypothetical protein G01um101466_559 [Parcubacteria group bacterium Gr01-1014_66]
MRILFTGGATGGHFFPILALIREIKRLTDTSGILDISFYYMGPDKFGESLLEEEGVRCMRVPSGKYRNYFSFRNVTDIITLAWGILLGFWKMTFIIPDVIVSKGGYGSIPALVAGIILRIPILVHESDAIPGKTSRISSFFADRIGVAFAEAAEFFPEERTAQVGIPLVLHTNFCAQEVVRERLSMLSDLPAVGCIGGSLGAQKLNEIILESLDELVKEYEVVHQTGLEHITAVKEEASIVLEHGGGARYHAFGFMETGEMEDFYCISDIVVSRAGASSIFEIALWGKPAILVPLERSAQDHQRKNAYAYAQTGAALVIEEGNLTPHILLAEIKKVLENPELYLKMSKAAQAFARPDSATIIAREILNLGVHNKG